MLRRPEQTRRRATGGAAGAAVLIAALALGFLTACTAGDSRDGSGSASGTAPHATASPTATGATPSATAALQPEGTASDNLAYFTAIVSGVWGGPDRASGRAYIDALVAGGFDKSAMQVTNDESTVGNAAESIQFSVLWAGECLVGQVGPATGDPVATVLPPAPGGTCLIGKTRPIDW